MPMMLTALLGLEPDGFTQRLRVVRPCLPPDVTRLALHGVRIGQGRVDLQFAQRGDAVSVEVLATEGKVQLELIQD
jgi:hypothetical protein